MCHKCNNLCQIWFNDVTYLITLWLQEFRAAHPHLCCFSKSVSMHETIFQQYFHVLPEAHTDTERIHGTNSSDTSSRAGAHRL